MLTDLEAHVLSRLPLLTSRAKPDWKLAAHRGGSSTPISGLGKDRTLFESDLDSAWPRNFFRMHSSFHGGCQSVDLRAGHVAGEFQYVNGCQRVCNSGNSEM
jgi:hypothetical protein